MSEIHIVAGRPTDEEIAVVVAVLLAHSSTDAPAPPLPPVSRWTRSARPGFAHRDGRPARPGPGHWRAAALPR